MKTDTLLTPMTLQKTGPLPVGIVAGPELILPVSRIFELAELVAPSGDVSAIENSDMPPKLPTINLPLAANQGGLVFSLNQADTMQPQDYEPTNTPGLTSSDPATLVLDDAPGIVVPTRPQPDLPINNKPENSTQIKPAARRPQDDAAQQQLAHPAEVTKTATPLVQPAVLPAKISGQLPELPEPAAAKKTTLLPVQKLQNAVPRTSIEPSTFITAQVFQSEPMEDKPVTRLSSSPRETPETIPVSSKPPVSDSPVQHFSERVSPTPPDPSHRPISNQVLTTKNRPETPFAPTKPLTFQLVQKPVKTPVQTPASPIPTQPIAPQQAECAPAQTPPVTVQQSANPTSPISIAPLAQGPQFSAELPPIRPVEPASKTLILRPQTTTRSPEPMLQTNTAPQPALIPQLPQPDTVDTVQSPDFAPIETQNNTQLTPASQPVSYTQPRGIVWRALQTITQAAIALQDRPIELTLNPEELGRVRLTLNSAEGAMAVSITVERPDTLDLLRRNIDILAQQLRDIGYQNLSFSFAGQGGEFARENPENAQSRNPVTGGETQAADATLTPLRINLDGTNGVDIRL